MRGAATGACSSEHAAEKEARTRARARARARTGVHEVEDEEEARQDGAVEARDARDALVGRQRAQRHACHEERAQQPQGAHEEYGKQEAQRVAIEFGVEAGVGVQTRCRCAPMVQRGQSWEEVWHACTAQPRAPVLGSVTKLRFTTLTRAMTTPNASARRASARPECQVGWI